MLWGGRMAVSAPSGLIEEGCSSGATMRMTVHCFVYLSTYIEPSLIKACIPWVDDFVVLCYINKPILIHGYQSKFNCLFWHIDFPSVFLYFGDYKKYWRQWRCSGKVKGSETPAGLTIRTRYESESEFCHLPIDGIYSMGGGWRFLWSLPNFQDHTNSQKLNTLCQYHNIQHIVVIQCVL